jgi:hypothetical protein
MTEGLGGKPGCLSDLQSDMTSTVERGGGMQAISINVHVGDEAAGGCSSSHHRPILQNPRLAANATYHKLEPLLQTSDLCHLPPAFFIFTTSTMTGTSSVGPISVNGAGDQRNVKNSELEQPERYEEGKVNSHDVNDSSKSHSPPWPQCELDVC